MGFRFALEGEATIGGYQLFVLRDRKNNNLIYLAPNSGLWVQKPATEPLPVPPAEGSGG